MQTQFTRAKTSSEPPGTSQPVEVPLLQQRARRLERRVVLASVLVPWTGLAAGIVLFWRRGIAPIDLTVFAVMYSIAALGIGVGFHRLITHRAFQATPLLRNLIVIAGSMAAQGPVIYWAALHRRHHVYSDREGDPHSPHLQGHGLADAFRGFWHAHMGWIFKHELNDWNIYARDLLADRKLIKLNQYYFVWLGLGLLLPAAVDGLITWSWFGALKGFIWGGAVRILAGQHVIWSVNSVCHIFGSRPYPTRDHSTNNFALAIPTFGESWHNTHHAFPGSAIHGLEWWQIDINGSVIRLCERLGLASGVRVPKVKQTSDDFNGPDVQGNGRSPWR